MEVQGRGPGKTGGGVGRGSEDLVGGICSVPSAEWCSCGGGRCTPALPARTAVSGTKLGGGHILLGSTGCMTGPWVPLRAHLL